MTDIFSFILVMVSLVLAIGVTRLVHGVAGLILVLTTKSMMLRFGCNLLLLWVAKNKRYNAA